MKSGLKNKLMKFLESSLRNQWLRGSHVSVYVRKGWHQGPDGKIHTYLDLANIEVDQAFHHKGIFTDVLSLCQELTPYDGVLVESVLNEGLRTHLQRKVAQDKNWHEKGFNFIWEKDGATGQI